MILQDYKVVTKINLSDLPSKKVFPKAKKKLVKTRKKLSKLQDKLYAHGKYGVLICLQGMDTSGKDSLIREVFKDINASGVNVISFKVPTEKELKHDFIWRHYLELPERGKFAIFNRTHYENVLVTRVHPTYILSENIPSIKSIEDITDDFYHQRMEQINNFEKHIIQNGTIVLKFYLNLSKEEQKNRLIRRINLKDKNWKFSPDDIKERGLWDKYMLCYEDLLNRTSTTYAPWFVVPADDKPSARLIVAQIILKTLEQYLDIKEPTLGKKTLLKLNDFKRQLEK